MDREKYKARKLVDELIGYFLVHGVQKITVDLSMDEEKTTIVLNGHANKRIHDIDELVELMNAHRRPELEDYYEHLVGNSYNSYELDLLGAMVDKANYKCDGENLWLKVTRYFEF
ncbi:MAG: hypothetical protein CSB16_00275 [Clostridiales bacterium]|nr:MAG: hypothetical protein CSB16_00275 [Clostridiales bacterium]